MARFTCCCSDPGCPVPHGATDCGKPARIALVRIDIGRSDGYQPFCQLCAEDALNSGVFADYPLVRMYPRRQR